MNALQLRFVSAGLLFLLILPLGLWLSHSGKPYGFILFNIHKLIGFGLFVFLAITVYWVNQSTPLSPPQLAACLVAALFFVATIVSGGMVSVSTTMPGKIKNQFGSGMVLSIWRSGG
jgi:hypothetical protein